MEKKKGPLFFFFFIIRVFHSVAFVIASSGTCTFLSRRNAGPYWRPASASCA